MEESRLRDEELVVEVVGVVVIVVVIDDDTGGTVLFRRYRSTIHEYNVVTKTARDSMYAYTRYGPSTHLTSVLSVAFGSSLAYNERAQMQHGT